jgi:hypothetical protein
MTAADGICGFGLQGFIALFMFGQNCFRSQGQGVEGQFRLKIAGLRLEGLPTARRKKCTQASGLSEWLLERQSYRFRFS